VDLKGGQGQGRAVNLMLRKGQAAGSLRSVTVERTTDLPLSPGARTALLYCVSGHCAVDDVPLSPGESLLLEDLSADVLALRGHAQLMLAEVSCT